MSDASRPGVLVHHGQRVAVELIANRPGARRSEWWESGYDKQHQPHIHYLQTSEPQLAAAARKLARCWAAANENGRGGTVRIRDDGDSDALFFFSPPLGLASASAWPDKCT